MIAQIYVDDIMFGGMSNKMVEHFVHQMQLGYYDCTNICG